MALELICPFCGHPNGIGKVFCAACGQNMQQGDSPPKVIGKNEMSAPMRVVTKLIKTFILLAIVLAVVGLFWPGKTDGVLAEGARRDADLAAFNAFSNRFEAARARVRSGQIPQATDAVTEAQVNAYLAEAIKNNNAKLPKGSFTPMVTDARVDFKSGQADLFLAYKIGPIRMTYELVLDPGAKDNDYAVRVVKARVGHVPLPGPAAALATSKFVALTKGLRSLGFVTGNVSAWKFVAANEMPNIQSDAAVLAILKDKPKSETESP